MSYFEDKEPFPPTMATIWAVDRTQILLDNIKRLLRRGETIRLRKITAKTHAADLSTVLRSLTPPEQAALFGLVESVGQKASYHWSLS